METLPLFVPILFALTTLLSIFFFYKAAHNSTNALLILFGWALLQSTISTTGFYLKTNTLPPRIMLTVAPALLVIAILFFTKKGKLFIDSLDRSMLTLLSVVRIPVEMVLFWLCISKAVPQIMTFEGHNFDILSGITALIIYFLIRKNLIRKKGLLIWNFICLALLINIVTIAILAVPTPFQQFGLDQPNIGILYFPFVLLPAVVVPLVLFSHLASIRQLLMSK